MNQKIKKLGQESLQKIITEILEMLSEEQFEKAQTIIEKYSHTVEGEELPQSSRMSQEFVDEKMFQVEAFMQQVEEGEICLHAEGYEDFSEGYWDSEWITDYYDDQGIGDKLLSALEFARDCVEDRRYREANAIYDWIALLEQKSGDAEARLLQAAVR